MWAMLLLLYGSAPFALLFLRFERWPAAVFETGGSGDWGNVSLWDFLLPFVVTPCIGFFFGIDAGIVITRLVRRARSPRLR